MKRKKRAKKSIKSIKKRIKEHELKLKEAEKENKIELVDYYQKELQTLKESLNNKKKIIER